MIDSIKQMMNGLSSQYAGEYLSSTEKDKCLHTPVIRNQANQYQTHQSNANIIKSNKKHIALLCNDVTNHNVINYVLENSKDCSVDILYHGMHKDAQSQSFYKDARSSFIENDVDVSLVTLINDSIDEVKNYLLQQRSLQFLVSDSHDQLIKRFLNNKIIKSQIYVPIVLIN